MKDEETRNPVNPEWLVRKFFGRKWGEMGCKKSRNLHCLFSHVGGGSRCLDESLRLIEFCMIDLDVDEAKLSFLTHREKSEQ